MTFAMLKDTGWYAVEWTKAKALAFGNKAGCDFTDLGCMFWNTGTSQPDTLYPEYCTTFNEYECTHDRYRSGVCEVFLHETAPLW